MDNVKETKEVEKIQNKFLNALRKTHQPVTLFLMNGFQMKGTVIHFDEFCVVLHSSGKDQMVYKHAISTVAPDATVDLKDG